ncbi:MAG TPA: SprT family zinc-dependent metalloprotease [Verrucomicrobiae bacterium]|nr:SprT family zinc-dependent metalloprotease [Verrucomicrobiae bacterium]
MTETLQIRGLNFEVRRSDRRRTFGLTVDRGGELIAHVPFATPVEELTRWINKKLVWVYRKLALKAESAPIVQPPEYISGEAFCYLGRRFSLKVVPNQKLPLRFDGTRFILRRDSCPAEAHFRRWYLDAGTEWLQRRVERLSQYTTRKPEHIEIRDLGFRWGSCGKSGIIYFNWKVLQLPVRLVDYIIMHELVHLVEGHHGPEFWRTLGRAMPDWQKRKDALANKAKDYLVFGLRL